MQFYTKQLRGELTLTCARASLFGTATQYVLESKFNVIMETLCVAPSQGICIFPSIVNVAMMLAWCSSPCPIFSASVWGAREPSESFEIEPPRLEKPPNELPNVLPFKVEFSEVGRYTIHGCRRGILPPNVGSAVSSVSPTSFQFCGKREWANTSMKMTSKWVLRQYFVKWMLYRRVRPVFVHPECSLEYRKRHSNEPY